MKNHIKGMTVLLVAAALLCAACGTTKKATAYRQEESQIREALQAQTEQVAKTVTDSVQYRFQNLQQEMAELRATFVEQIPMIQVRETIPMQSLIDLPEGAKFGESSGRATVEAQRRGDNIILTGTCDSVARQCAILERKATRQQNTIDSLSKALQHKDSELSQMAVKLNSNSSQMGAATEETRKPPRKVGGWFVAGTALGLAGGAGANLLWKRFHVGAVVKRIFT